MTTEDENEPNQVSLCIFGPSIEIKITPDYREDWEFRCDGNLIIVSLQAHVFGCHVEFYPILHLKKLQQFEIAVRSLYQEVQSAISLHKEIPRAWALSERAELQGAMSLHLEDNSLDLEGEIDKCGHIHWSGSIAHTGSYDLTLKFKFTSDQSYLPPLLEQISQIHQKFPLVAEEESRVS